VPILSEKHPELLNEWHPYMNLPLTTNRYVDSRQQKIWWVCKKNPTHVFRSTLNSKIASKKGGCRYCSGKAVLREDSLSKNHPDIAAEWHLVKNKPQFPYEFLPRSNARVWWKCPKGEDHEWSAKIDERTRENGGNTCPFCAGRKLSVTNSLAVKNPELAKQFNERKNECKAEHVLPSDNSKKMWWVCPRNPNHEWAQHVSVRYKGSGCPLCKNKWETAATNAIEEILPRKARIERQHPLGGFFFDIRIDIEREKYLIELDGEQHYEDKPHWEHLLIDQQARDKEKTEIAKDRGFSFGRIPYWVRPKEIRTELCNLLAKEPTFPSVPRAADRETQNLPVLSEKGRLWIPWLEE